MVKCPYCGETILEASTFCPNCGSYIKADSEVSSEAVREKKVIQPKTEIEPQPKTTNQGEIVSSSTALLLALLLGLMGLMGMGHFYIKRYKRGVFILALGIVFPFLLIYSILFLAFTTPMLIMGYIMLIPIFGIGWLLVLIWQTFDANNLANYYNKILKEKGHPPW